VFLKRRERQRGLAQYERMARTGVVATVAEARLSFEVNFSDYLDTGLFLDHRPTRAWLRELAEGKRFLNLFAYTATASVYAAAGGAASTTSVDLSTTYTEWARRNLERNALARGTNRVIRADVLEWVSAAGAAGEQFDLVFCDPPTFSNSKRMKDTWDVQRDHAALITSIAKLLSDDGLLVFSCNRRKFAFDRETLEAAGLTCEDVTARTIPKDFERRGQVHSCWTVRRSKG
jgi:23S rRNA (guanine2445-N2)-methyltransferase / 23S rRNA (guanine2069-N7)-methyltransferase